MFPLNCAACPGGRRTSPGLNRARGIGGNGRALYSHGHTYRRCDGPSSAAEPAGPIGGQTCGRGRHRAREKENCSAAFQLASLEVSGPSPKSNVRCSGPIRFRITSKIFNPPARRRKLSSVSFLEGWRISYRAASAWRRERVMRAILPPQPAARWKSCSARPQTSPRCVRNSVILTIILRLFGTVLRRRSPFHRACGGFSQSPTAKISKDTA